MALTETDIKALQGSKPTRDQWINDGEGLYLRISSRTGRMAWVWRVKKRGRTSYTTIGTWPALTVKAARAALAKRTGRATPPNALTVQDALEEWFKEQIRPRYRVTKSIRTYVDRAITEFGSRRLQELTRAEIARFVRGYAKSAPVAANRCLSTLKLALGWCVEIGYLDGNPAEGLTRRVAGGVKPLAIVSSPMQRSASCGAWSRRTRICCAPSSSLAAGSPSSRPQASRTCTAVRPRSRIS